MLSEFTITLVLPTPYAVHSVLMQWTSRLCRGQVLEFAPGFEPVVNTGYTAPVILPFLKGTNNGKIQKPYVRKGAKTFRVLSIQRHIHMPTTYLVRLLLLGPEFPSGFESRWSSPIIERQQRQGLDRDRNCTT